LSWQFEEKRTNRSPDFDNRFDIKQDGKRRARESKIPGMKARGFFVSDNQLVDNNDVAGLKTLGALFNSELDLLAFLQILKAFALNRREVDKDIIAAFASEEAVALCSVKPLDCTVDTFRHFCLLMANKKYGGYSLGSASERLNGVKQSGSRTIREPTWYFQSKLLVSYARKDNMKSVLCQ